MFVPAKTLPPPPGQRHGIRAEQQWQAIFEEFWRELTATANFRTTALTDNQMFDLRNAISSTEKQIRFFRHFIRMSAEAKGQEAPTTPGTGLPEDINFYRNIYQTFVEIAWLKLPEEMPVAAG